MLRIYISAHCTTCDTTRHLAEFVQAERPDMRVSVVDVDAPNADVPKNIVGTPVYTWNDQIVFLGNPSEAELLRRVSVFYDTER